MAKRNHRWTEEDDAIILVGLERGVSIRKIAAQLGPKFTRNMVIGRSRRIRGIVSPREKDKILEAQRRVIARAAEREQQRREIKRIALAEMGIVHNTHAFLGERNKTILIATQAGIPLKTIGEYFGITYQRVQQIRARYG